jgi:putative phosphoesterase
MPNKSTPIEKVRARRIGLISDTHFMKPNGSDVPARLLKALEGLDLIVHLGHISSAASLDRLERVAPVLAVQTPLDDRLMGEALSAEIKRGRTAGHTRVIEAGGLRIGCVHNLSAGSPKISVVNNERLKFPAKPLKDVLQAKLGTPVEVVAFANTHAEIVACREGVLFVNPGSPNLPGGARQGRPGTIAVLEIDKGTAHVEIVDLARR